MSREFNLEHVLEELRHHLPSQTPLKDFIHHNSLHSFQHEKFYDAIFKSSKIFGHKASLQLSEFRQLFKNDRIKESVLDRIIKEKKGAEVKLWKDRLLNKEYDTSNEPLIGKLRSEWKKQYHIDLDNQVQPLLFRLLSNYLDQGISLTKFPDKGGGFLNALKQLEQNSFTSIFKTSGTRKIFQQDDLSIQSLLNLLVGDPSFYEQYLFDQQFSHKGWSGMVCAIENSPDVLLDKKTISLNDLIVFELLLEIDALNYALGTHWEPLCRKIKSKPTQLFGKYSLTELNQTISLWQDAFEWTYYNEVLNGLQKSAEMNDLSYTDTRNASFQALFCIDERECSLRRHIETVDPNSESFGTPGFFGVEFYYKPQNGNFYDKLCPAPVFPKFLIKETDSKHVKKHELIYHHKLKTGIGELFNSFAMGYLAFTKMAKNLTAPKMSPAISNAFAHMDSDAKLTIENKDPNEIENGLQIGFTIEDMAIRVEGLLKSIGLTNQFAPLVYIVAHGSSSANNPHHGAHDCGACSGRPGSINARVAAFMANHKKVRELLTEKGISIPDKTQFIGALHDTAADEIQYFDTDLLSVENAKLHAQNSASFENALDLNAKERSRRFASINTNSNLRNVRKAIKNRSVSLFEPRPELGHGTNSLCVVGSRKLTKSLFLDRRAFLNSYNYKNDPEGTILSGIMKPIGPVCGGINLEYYFSRVDNYKLGAGTKLPHNVVGLIGVSNSSDGDLRPGLPLQMIEVHDPVRLMVIVEHDPAVVLKTIKSVPEMYEWYINEWIHLVAVNPETKQFSYFKNGEFEDFQPQETEINTFDNFIALIETAKEMESNAITDATKENLPVYQFNPL